MAKSPKLVAAVAAVVKKPEETVRVALRRLHEAELIEVTGRGRGGKDMTPRDAAMLLLAMSMGTMLKDSPATIQEYWNLPLLPADPYRFDNLHRSPGDRVPALTARFFGKMFTKKLTPVDTLGMVLSTIIDLAAQGSLFPRPERNDFEKPREPHIQVPSRVPFSHLQVKIYAPWRAASIQIEMNMQWSSEMLFGQRAALAEEAFPGESRLADADYVEIRQFSEKAILFIGESLR